jgi:hypothetical protein
LAAALATLQKHPELPTVSEVVQKAEDTGFVIQDRRRLEALVTARDLGLIRQDRNVLTQKGEALARLDSLKPDLFVDVVHGLLYESWDFADKRENCFSWSYRTLCRILWEGGDAELPTRRRLASEVETQAKSRFAQSDIAFSPKSVGGALLWLSDLTPPVLVGDGSRFSRRAFCPPELLVMATDFVYRDRSVDYGVNLLLNDSNRTVICHYCLLDPERLDRVIEYAVAQFDCLHKGIGGGWGQYLVLERHPEVAEFE